jgi:tetratricopeptide (TPR) repeat protein
MMLQDYAGAADAYDQAFASVYPNIAEDERPWRMMWYQTGPYWAYFYSGRYYDVISLATTTLDAMSKPVLEESYYWRALAREALGDTSGAIADLKEAVRLNPNFLVGQQQLDRIQGGA